MKAKKENECLLLQVLTNKEKRFKRRDASNKEDVTK